MTKRHLAVLTAVLSLLIAILLMPQPDRRQPPGGIPDRVSFEGRPSAVELSVAPAKSKAAPLPTPEPTKLAHLIDHIAIDKSEVCPHEDFSVQAFETPSEEEVSFIIGDQRGAVTVRRESVAGHWRIPVVASRGNAEREYGEVSIDVLPADHPRCRDATAAMLELEYSPYRDALVFATVSEASGLTPPLFYTWDFGDGTTLQGREPTVQHSYAERAEHRLTSSFVITVEVMDNQGQVVQTRGSVYFPNLYYEARLVSGNRVLRSVTDPLAGTPERGVQTRVSIDNMETDPVQFSRASLSFEPCDGVEEPSSESVSPESLLSQTILPEGQTTEVQLRLAPERIPVDTCRVTVELAGDTVPPHTGQPISESGPPYTEVNTQMTYVLQSFPVHEGGHPLDRHSEQVTDSHQLEQLAKAMRLLGKQRITVSELDELQRTGKL